MGKLTSEEVRALKNMALNFSRDCGGNKSSGLYSSAREKSAKDLVNDAKFIYKYLAEEG